MSTFRFIAVLIDDDKMILCQKESFDNMTEDNKQRLIRKAFLGTNLRKRNWIGRIRKIPYKIINRCQLYLRQFNHQMEQLEDENQWEKSPFMALWIHKKLGTQYLSVSAGNL